MALMLFLKRLVGGTGEGGLFAYLAKINDNKTRIEVERARQATASDLLSNLRDGVVLRQSTADGWTLEIWMPPSQATPMFILQTDSRESAQDSPHATELAAQHAKALNQKATGTAGDSPQEGSRP
jgi:hypothetical protein